MLFEQILQMLPHLRSVDLSFNEPLTDTAVRDMFHKNKALETLLLNHCPVCSSCSDSLLHLC